MHIQDVSQREVFRVLNPQDTILLIIDPQPARLDALGESVRASMVNNLQGLAKLARLYALPVMVLTETGAGPVPEELAASWGMECRIERAAGTAIDLSLLDRLRGLKRGNLIIAGLAGNGSLADIALAVQKGGYRIHIATDAVAEAHGQVSRGGILRMTGSSIRLTSWVSIVAEFASMAEMLPDGFDMLRGHLDSYMFPDREGLANYPFAERNPVASLGQVA